MRIYTSLIATLFLFSAMPAAEAEDLGAALTDSGWGGIIGTWVDIETKGRKHKVTYRWIYKGKAIEVVSREGEKESTAIIGMKPDGETVFHMGVDNEGGSFIGEWTEDGQEAVLGLAFVTGKGEEGAIEIRQKLVAADALQVKVMLPEPMTIMMMKQ